MVNHWQGSQSRESWTLDPIKRWEDRPLETLIACLTFHHDVDEGTVPFLLSSCVPIRCGDRELAREQRKDNASQLSRSSCKVSLPHRTNLEDSARLKVERVLANQKLSSTISHEPSNIPFFLLPCLVMNCQALKGSTVERREENSRQPLIEGITRRLSQSYDSSLAPCCHSINLLHEINAVTTRCKR